MSSPKTHSGLLISFEGGEGSGKSTQMELLRQKLTEQGREVIAVREPGGTPIAEQIREVVLSSKNKGIEFTTEVLLFQAARAQIYAEMVLPNLAKNNIVLMDRTRDSSVVYQGMARGFGVELIEQLNDISTKSTYPDLTFFLDVPVEEGIHRRRETKEINRLDQENQNFHQKVRQSYMQLAQSDQQKRWRVIDAASSIEKVEQSIWQEVSEYLQHA